MTPVKEKTNTIQELLNLHPYRNALVPCVCVAGSPFPPNPDCEFCDGRGKIMYSLSEVEVI